MTVFDTNRTAAASGTFSFIAAIYASVIDWNDARLTRKALNGLTTRELEDIGLSRGDIDLVTSR